MSASVATAAIIPGDIRRLKCRAAPARQGLAGRFLTAQGTTVLPECDLGLEAIGVPEVHGADDAEVGGPAVGGAVLDQAAEILEGLPVGDVEGDVVQMPPTSPPKGSA